MTARLPAIVSAPLSATVPGPVRTVATAGIKVEKFTADSVSNPTDHAASMTRMHKTLEAVAKQAQTNPRAGQIIFEGLGFSAGGVKLSITHRLGHRVKWACVRWQGAAAGASLVEHPSSDVNTLVLSSYVLGIGDIEVF